MNSFRITRSAAALVAAVCLFGTAVLAQPPLRAGGNAPLDTARVHQKIADQKAESDAITAIRDAERLLRTNPARAVQLLRAAQNNIAQSPAISDDTRKTLTVLLQAKIASAEGKPLAGNGLKGGAAAKAQAKDAFDAMLAEVKEVQEGVNRIAKLQDANRNAEADREIATLGTKYPNNPAVLALTQKDGFGKRVADSRLFARMQSERVTLAMNDVMRSSLPAKGDIEFPADWKERTARRKKLEPELSAKTKALIEALDKPLTLSFQEKPLDYVLQELSNKMGQELWVDGKSLSDLGIDLKKPVSLEARGLSARTILRQVLGGQGLTFVVKEEIIQVVTVERSRDMLVTRVYYLGDLVQGVGTFGGAATWGTFLDYEQTMANVKLVIDAIQSSVDPLSWKDKGGPGTVTFHFPSMSLIVRASSEVHAALGSKLGGGR